MATSPGILPLVQLQKNLGNSNSNMMKPMMDTFTPKSICSKHITPKKENIKYKEIRIYRNYEACSECKSRSKSSLGTEGRTIQDRQFQKIVDEVDRRTEESLDMFKKRKQTVERPFGTVKRSREYPCFLTRRTESVRVESLLHFLVFIVKRVTSIVGTQELMGILHG